MGLTVDSYFGFVGAALFGGLAYTTWLLPSAYMRGSLWSRLSVDSRFIDVQFVWDSF